MIQRVNEKWVVTNEKDVRNNPITHDRAHDIAEPFSCKKQSIPACMILKKDYTVLTDNFCKMILKNQVEFDFPMGWKM